MGDWRIAPEISAKEPGGWMGNYASQREARQAGREMFEGPYYVAHVKQMRYADLLPSGAQLIADMRERVADRNSDTACFDRLAKAEVGVLGDLVARAVSNWEEWLRGRAADKVSSVVFVDNIERFTNGA